MAVKINKGRALESLTMTPLIDVVFNLLIFFLVAAKFAEQERELDLKLPSASEAQPLISRPTEIFVNIDADGQYFVSGQFLDVVGLYSVLKANWERSPGRVSVIIRADRRCRWQHIVAAMNACRKAHIRDYRVATIQEGG